jgi:putative membrane protein
MRTFIIVAAAAGLLSACGQQTEDTAVERTEGPVVSAPEAPMNAPIDTAPTTDAAQTPGASSFTEAQARGAIEAAGYTDVGVLTQDANGLWKGTAMRDGKSTSVSVDYKGAVSTQ